MPQVSDYREAPYQGVSQAPPQSRLVSQAEGLEDSLIAIPQGWQPRPPFTWLGKLAGHPGHTDGIFAPLANGTSFLTLTFEAGAAVPRVYDLDGLVPHAVTVQSEAQTYLNTGLPSPHAEVGVTSVVDYTFLANRNVLVANSGDSAAARDPEGIVWVRQSAYGRTYSVTVTPDGGSPVTATLKTPTGATTASADYIDSDRIAQALLSGVYTATDGATISGSLTGIPGVTVTRQGAVLAFTSDDEFTISVTDGQGGTAMIAAKGKVQAFSDLPKFAPNGFTIRISQSTNTTQDDYYVRFEETAGTGTGVWKECLAPGAELGLDPETMPVGLVNDGGWKINVLAWKQRTTGDQDLVPDPDFVGQVVQDVVYWRGRLGIVAGEGCTLSDTNDPFKLYPSTLVGVLDSDPFGRVNPGKTTTTFNYGIPFESRLVLFGQKVQCQITASGVLKPSTADIDEMTHHEFSPLIAPLPAHGHLYFLAPKGTTASTLYEMQIDLVTNVAAGEDLSAAIPRYLPAGLDRAAISPVTFTAVYGTSGQRRLPVHLFRYAEGQRVQNGFMRWWVPEGYTLGGMWFSNSTLYLLACKTGEAHVLSCDLSPDILDEGSTRLLTHLDFRCTEDAVPTSFDPDTGLTRCQLPYNRTSALRVTVRAPGDVDRPEGLLVPIAETETEAAPANEVFLSGNWAGASLWFGFAYAARWDLSPIYKLGQDSRPDRTGRLSIRKLEVDYAEAGFLRAEVTVKGRTTRHYRFEGLVLGSADAVTDQAARTSGVFSFGVQSHNERVSISLINDSHFGSKVPGFAWTGEFNPRAVRLG